MSLECFTFFPTPEEIKNSEQNDPKKMQKNKCQSSISPVKNEHPHKVIISSTHQFSYGQKTRLAALNTNKSMRKLI